MQHGDALQALEDSLENIQEDKIAFAVKSTLELLRTASAPAVTTLEAGGSAESGDEQESGQVLYRVRCCCVVLQRAASLAACSSFVLPELLLVLQERLHGSEPVSDAILDTHLGIVLDHPQAFELILRSLPSQPQRQSLFYARLVGLLSKGSHEAMKSNASLIHHARREIQRVILNDCQQKQQETLPIGPEIILLPHVPMLLKLSLLINPCTTDTGETVTMNSSVSEGTTFPDVAGVIHSECCSTSEEDLSARTMSQRSSGLGLQAAASALHFVKTSDRLLSSLGLLAKPRPKAADAFRSSCLAEIFGPSSLSGSQLPVADHVRVAMDIVDFLLDILAANPEASKAVLSFSQRDQNSDFKLPENESAMPDSSASNRVQSKEDKSISGEGKKLETRQRSFPDTLDREKTALQLLELHASLADLSVKMRKAAEENATHQDSKLLSNEAMLWLLDAALKSLQGNNLASRETKHITRRNRSSYAGASNSSISPAASAHLLRKLQHRFSQERSGGESTPGNSFDARGIAESAMQFSSVAFKGPIPGRIYRSDMANVQALVQESNKHIGKTETPRPVINLEGRSRDVAGPPTKRQRTEQCLMPENTVTTLQPPVPGRLSRFGLLEKDSLQRKKDTRQLETEPSRIENASEGMQNKAGDPLKASLASKPPGTPQPANSEKSQSRGSSVPRRITPTPMPRSGSKPVLKSEIPDSLLRDKDEYEAYWEHYISVKEELVEKILQDTVEDENEQLLGGGSSSACHTAEGKLRSAFTSSVNFNPEFRDLGWQDLHSSSLGLLNDALEVLTRNVSDSAKASIAWKLLEGEPVWADHRQMVLLGSRIVDPSVASGVRHLSAQRGGKAFPHECLVLGLSTRLAQYCIGPGAPIQAHHASIFLNLLIKLIGWSIEESGSLQIQSPNARLTRPMKLIGGVLTACLERGCLSAVLLSQKDATALLQCVLWSLDPITALLYLSTGIWAVLAGRIPGSKVLQPPSWILNCWGWSQLWRSLATRGQIKVAIATALSQCPEFISIIMQDPSTEQQGAALNTDSRWEALTSLSMALRSLNSAIPVEGKNLVTGSSLGDALLVAAILLKLSALACDQLLQRLSADHQKPSAKERSKADRKPIRSKRQIARQEKGMTSAFSKSDETGSSWQLAASCAAGALLASSSRKLLAWRKQRCPNRAKESAEALVMSCSLFETQCLHLMEARQAGASSCLGSRHLEEVEDSVGSILSEVEDDEGILALQAGVACSSSEALSLDREDLSNSRRGFWRPQNAYLKAALEEHRKKPCNASDDESGYSDLEDFIVCKPGRDYSALIHKDFRYTPSSPG